MRGVCLAVVASLAAVHPALGQTGPAEPPPPGFSERQFVDSTGCVFQRAGISGAVVWVPRLGADNQPVCGMAPSVAAAEPAATAAPAPADAATAAAPEPAAAPKPAGGTMVARKAHSPRPPALVETESVARAMTRCLARIETAQRYLVSDGRRVTKCGPAAEDGVAFLNGIGAPGLSVAGADDSPQARDRARRLGQAGYRLTWANGPVASEDPPLAAAGRYWVQVGAFAESGNADRAVARVQALDLPAARQPVHAGALRAVLAGPFATQAEAAAALDLLRSSGFPEAFARR